LSFPRKPRLWGGWETARFAYQTLIAPWPPILVLLVIIGVIGGLTPLLLVRAASGLIDALTARRAAASTPGTSSLLASLRPYLPWLLLLIGMRIVNWLIYMDSFQRYLGAQLNERVRERFDRLFYQKALSLRLECFESSAYYDLLQRARQAMIESEVAQQLYQGQRLLSTSLGCLGILCAFARVSWMIALALLLGTLFLIQWHLRRGREFIEINYGQTPLQRRRDYWRGLVTQRAPAAREEHPGPAAPGLISAYQRPHHRGWDRPSRTRP
jgi:ABC-type multidrug transport system fused ATPase/permease subunit